MRVHPQQKARQGSAITIDALDEKTELNNPRARLFKLFPESSDDNTYIIAQRSLTGNKVCLAFIDALLVIVQCTYVIPLSAFALPF